ncbi:hypothetical protein [Undibacterium luofuense]|uniref:DUF8213 domain-containing protein n=1 Tax=Undibacterium luofuense TaxID=2828733 RepID=A0A941DKW4_9BURK|nr:hypothetical protein [Undibacterium luofuense]MBR7782713.1 hypothetical protein [Undibacterium luofuense]
MKKPRSFTFFYFIFFISSLFAVLNNVNAQQIANVSFNSTLTEQDLQTQLQQKSFAPGYKLSYSKYDVKQGLETIYESIDGKKIYFRSIDAGKNKFQLRVSHYNPTSRKIEVLVETKAVDGKNKLLVAGTDLMEVIAFGRKNKRFQSHHLKKLRTFMRSDEGIATMDGIAAIYLVLETNASTPEVEKFKVPLGGIRTALELITSQYNGIDHLDQLVPADKIKSLQDNCSVSGKCIISNKMFSLHKSGFFDVLSSIKPAHASKLAAAPSCLKSSSPAGSALTASGGNCSDPLECCGRCGIGCEGPLGQVWTSECFGHDNCVSQFSHLECMFGTPGDCRGNCSSLLDAIGSFLCETIFSWFCGSP